MNNFKKLSSFYSTVIVKPRGSREQSKRFSVLLSPWTVKLKVGVEFMSTSFLFCYVFN